MRKRGLVAGAIGVTVIAAAALRGVLRRFEIEQGSMAPALELGDWVVAKRRVGVPHRGDIVVFRDPADTGMYLVKRVIGLGGETIGIESGRVTINGALLADRWANGLTAPDGVWPVPEGHVWVLGDNRGASASDGRTIGPTAVSDISWEIVGRYWPASRTGPID
jgi:signal peptidase I